MTKNRKTIAELISPNLPEEQVAMSRWNLKSCLVNLLGKLGSPLSKAIATLKTLLLLLRLRYLHSLRDLRFNTIPSNLSSSSPFLFGRPSNPHLAASALILCTHPSFLELNDPFNSL
ncbi:hypothetical protein ACMD2_20690 [Ananas comosus]|uniref:Uncharacterized protein n=1 Tax=Ananas comosus TaxID=4615 RepID=A0A199UF93_ANACO|nr:hypothetical protein ACMD2_20690 [Ananas comosus]